MAFSLSHLLAHLLQLIAFFVVLIPIATLQNVSASFESDPLRHGAHNQVPMREAETTPSATASSTVSLTQWYSAMLDAIMVMQDEYYTCSIGTWPETIDWTAEVVASQISTSLFAVSHSNTDGTRAQVLPGEDHENLINRYFSHIISFYFGEDAFSLRQQAYDDMLWVVLGWLESIKFINVHSNLHYATKPSRNEYDSENASWYAQQFIPQFSHRARLFYDLAARGWDTSLCGGGMVWNSRLTPYKNAITNELYITASIWMYLYHPGDDDAAPFVLDSFSSPGEASSTSGLPPVQRHNHQYLENAITAYEWLNSSGMRNDMGLYVDGFHIRGWRGGRNPSKGTGRCDVRDEKVYTYNQGVVLSGLRSLWEATGNVAYLVDGHELIRNVINATGWAYHDNPLKWGFVGLGRRGVMEELCDWYGTCSQDGQTFKGIFFWHFSTFCAALPTADDAGNWGGSPRPWLHDQAVHSLHRQSCESYEAWVRTNAKAAAVTRDQSGLMGSWWGRPANLYTDVVHGEGDEDLLNTPPPPLSEGTDYRNDGVPHNDLWRLRSSESDDENHGTDEEACHDRFVDCDPSREPPRRMRSPTPRNIDPNDRGRGRTIETQQGGLSVIRAALKLALERERSQSQGKREREHEDGRQ